MKGNEGIILFISRGLRHPKLHSQLESDMWHVLRRNGLTSSITNEVVTRGTSNHNHKCIRPRNDMGPRFLG